MGKSKGQDIPAPFPAAQDRKPQPQRQSDSPGASGLRPLHSSQLHPRHPARALKTPELKLGVGGVPEAGEWNTRKLPAHPPAHLAGCVTSGARVSLGSCISLTDEGESPRCSGVSPSLSLRVPEACTENPKFQALAWTGSLTHMTGKKEGSFWNPHLPVQKQEVYGVCSSSCV